MIDFRYHLVSLVAVLLALAIGLILGSTTLQSTVVGDLNHRANSVLADNGQLRQQNDKLQSQVSDDDSFATALAPYALQGRLTGVPVVMISAPDASDSTRSALQTAIRQANGQLAADIRLQSTYVDPKNDALLTSLATELGGHSAGRESGSQLAAGQLASALAYRNVTRRASSQRLAEVVGAFSEGKLISLQGSARAGAMAIILTGAAPTQTTKKSQRLDQALVQLTAAFRDHGRAVLLAGPTGADSGAGALAAASSAGIVGDRASMMPAVETPQGPIAAVFALLDAASGHGSAFSAPLSPVRTLPTPTSSVGPSATP